MKDVDSRKSVVRKVAATAGAITMLGPVLNPPVADADIIYVDDRPVSATPNDGQGSSINWDVDGDGTGEFQMWVRSSSAYFSSYMSSQQFQYSFYRYGAVHLASNGFGGTQLNGAGLIGPAGASVSSLFSGFVVGTNPAQGMWGVTSQLYRSVLRTVTQTFRTPLTSMFDQGSEIGDAFSSFGEGRAFIGFRFDRAGQLHYGWAEIEIDFGAVTLTRWAYENDANTAINVAEVPEPGSLAMLATGAAGVLSMRRRRK